MSEAEKEYKRILELIKDGIVSYDEVEMELASLSLREDK